MNHKNEIQKEKNLNKKEIRKENKNKFIHEVKENKKEAVVISLFIVVIFLFSLATIISPKKDFSDAERRKLSSFPKISLSSTLSGDFMEDFESATLDQFPLRDGFRSVKAYVSKYLFLNLENHGIYERNGYLSKLEYPRNEKRVSANLQTINRTYETYLKDTDCNIYLSLIPDKNMFLTENSLYPSMDYEKFKKDVKENTPFARFIDIQDDMDLSMFYYTDQHWKQEEIIPVAEHLLTDMNASSGFMYEKKTVGLPFYGTYAKQSALNVKPDELNYLTNDVLDNVKVLSYGTGTEKEVSLYDMKKAAGRDPYEMFLLGSEPLLVIENEKAETSKELIIFRDSFGSSLAPLLVPAYKKVTIIDLRYIDLSLLSSYVTFDDQDVLFIYSTLILNNSISK